MAAIVSEFLLKSNTLELCAAKEATAVPKLPDPSTPIFCKMKLFLFKAVRRVKLCLLIT